MKIEDKLVASVISGLKALYGQEVPEKMVQIQKTKKEFEGHLTLVVFPFLKMSRKGPEQTAQEIGEYLKANEPAVAAFNVIKGFLNLTIASATWIELLNEIQSDEEYGLVKATETSPLVMIEYSSPNTNKPLHLGHVRNNLLNETFGICENKRKATDKQKAEIKAKKDEIISALLGCKTLEEMLACEVARPYMSAAWRETSEAMIIRKMRNNAIKKHPKDLNAMATQSLMQMDETYQQTQEEIAENANSEDFVVDAEAKEVESAAVEAEVVESAENDENLPDFMKD